MSKIIAVRVQDRFVELLPQGIDRLGRLFEIDSVSLVLGKNGSGKTRLLTTLANAVGSPQDDAVQFYFKDTPNGNYEPSAPYSETLCAVYYSALPYRRKLSRRSGVLDASPNNKAFADDQRLEKLGDVAKALGVETRLTGFFGYTGTVFRSVLIPELRSAHEILVSPLDSAVHDLNRLLADVSTDGTKGYRDFDGKREAAYKKIESILTDEIDVRLGDYDRSLFLVALEYMHLQGDRYNKNAATIAFLNHIGLTNNHSEPSAFQDLEEIVESTRTVLDNYANPQDFNWRNRAHKFQIDGIAQSAAIKSHKTPIKIEWSDLSSGLQALVEQFSLIDEAVGKAAEQGRFSILLLIDEGDAYLHLDWQRRYFSLLNKFLGELKRKYRLHSLQLIMATHSPLLAADIPGELITNLENGQAINSFAAPLEEIIAGSFGSSSLGEFAAEKINEIYKRILSSNLTDADRHVVEVIGDVAIKSALKRRFPE